jgi:AbrB family looped-hinge helix DNA binding protein
LHYLVRVRKHGQITIPAPLRKELGLVEGTILELTIENGRIILTKVPPENQTTPTTKPETTEDTKEKTTAKELKAALKESEEGKTRAISELIAELGLKKDIPN